MTRTLSELREVAELSNRVDGKVWFTRKYLDSIVDDWNSDFISSFSPQVVLALLEFVKLSEIGRCADKRCRNHAECRAFAKLEAAGVVV